MSTSSASKKRRSLSSLLRRKDGALTQELAAGDESGPVS